MALWFSRCLKNISENIGFIIDFETRPCQLEVTGSNEWNVALSHPAFLPHQKQSGKADSKSSYPVSCGAGSRTKLISCTILTAYSYNHSPWTVGFDQPSSLKEEKGISRELEEAPSNPQDRKGRIPMIGGSGMGVFLLQCWLCLFCVKQRFLINFFGDILCLLDLPVPPPFWFAEFSQEPCCNERNLRGIKMF